MKNNSIWLMVLGFVLGLALGAPLSMRLTSEAISFPAGHMTGWTMPMMYGGNMMIFGMLSMTLTSLGTLVLIGLVIALLVKAASSNASPTERSGFKP